MVWAHVNVVERKVAEVDKKISKESALADA